jgi:hypothetical protein
VPCAISPAVSSISTSGRRFARTTIDDGQRQDADDDGAYDQLGSARSPIVALMLPRSAPTIRCL